MRLSLFEEISHEMIYNKVREIVENDLLQIFGFSGSEKTTFVYYIARECSENSLNVLYIDTERNLNRLYS